VYKKGGHYLDALGLFPSDGSDVADTDAEKENVMSPLYDEGRLVIEQTIAKETTFTDIVGHYAEESILLAKKAKIINGYNEYTFGPDDGLTREQAAWICMRAGKISYDEANWEETALKYGIISEKGNGNAPITREEFAHMAVATYEANKVKYELTTNESFNDISSVAEKYYNDVLVARELELLVGDGDNNFRPKDGLTRAEAAVVAIRLANY